MKKIVLTSVVCLMAFSMILISGISNLTCAEYVIATAPEAEPGMGGEDLGVGVEIEEDTTVNSTAEPSGAVPGEGTEKPAEEGAEGTYDW
ncbi:MAG: hypothetical protein HZA78_05645 [Candidatus Schekmanbacteria bacterium]|nr:hypothetical protein [Candidatus Schekmanbacteria bacterium]